MKLSKKDKYNLTIFAKNGQRQILKPILSAKDALYWATRIEKLGGKAEIGKLDY